MSTPSRENALDHVVVVMFENRTFDNLLGRLYQPGEVASFEGVLGKELGNPIPLWAEHGADREIVPYRGRGEHGCPEPGSGGGVHPRQHPAYAEPPRRAPCSGQTGNRWPWRSCSTTAVPSTSGSPAPSAR